MIIEPQDEHRWLHRLVGDWTAEMSCQMGPDQPAWTSTGGESVRSLGGLWTLGEGSGTMPDGTPTTSLMTLGYDPAKGRFVGSFIASMMTHLWLYDGALSADGTTLTLDSHGPTMAGDGAMSAYRDIIVFDDPDTRRLISEMPGPEGNWVRFMTATYRRNG